jgi:hypothetical protein
VDWLSVIGGVALLLWGVRLFADFATDTIADWLEGRVNHD